MDDSMTALSKVIELLNPFTQEERTRILRAVAAFLGESNSIMERTGEEPSADLTGLSPRARVWIKQSSLTTEQLEQVFHFSSEGVEVIAPQMPGKNRKEQTFNAYVVTGIAQLLQTGDASFDDKAARALCERSGCYDSANHSAHLRDRGNEFTGSKEKGWTLTSPGLKRGAELVRELNNLGA